MDRPAIKYWPSCPSPTTAVFSIQTHPRSMADRESTVVADERVQEPDGLAFEHRRNHLHPAHRGGGDILSPTPSRSARDWTCQPRRAAVPYRRRMQAQGSTVTCKADTRAVAGGASRRYADGRRRGCRSLRDRAPSEYTISCSLYRPRAPPGRLPLQNRIAQGILVAAAPLPWAKIQVCALQVSSHLRL
jgi:hypothetical protein